MVDTSSKYKLVEIGKLKMGDLFYFSKELEDEGYKISNVKLFRHLDVVVGVGVKTGEMRGWRQDCLVYVKEGDKDREG